MKKAKTMLRGNIGAHRKLDTHKASLTLLYYLNIPFRDIDK